MERLQQISETYKLLGDKSRLQILAMLQQQELCVCDIVEAMDMTQPNVSQHMRKLKSAGIVQERKQGQWVYYSIGSNIEEFLIDALKHVPIPESRFMKLHELKSIKKC